jgi:hypothetical protein
MNHDTAIGILDKIQTQEIELHHDILLCAVRYAPQNRLVPRRPRQTPDNGRRW